MGAAPWLWNTYSKLSIRTVRFCVRGFSVCVCPVSSNCGKHRSCGVLCRLGEGDCFQLYQLDGDDTSELETSTKMEGPDLPLDLHSFAPGLACQLPLRAGVKDEADMDTVLARYEAEIDGSALPTDHSDACAGLPQPTSFLKPFGAAVEKQLLREKTVSSFTYNSPLDCVVLRVRVTRHGTSCLFSTGIDDYGQRIIICDERRCPACFCCVPQL